MTKEDIQKILDLHPQLNDFGIGLYEHGRGLTSEELKCQLEKNRQELLESEEACTRACQWLQSLEKVKTINLDASSYAIKHYAEPVIGYLTNGQLITAAIHSGFAYKMNEGPNVHFGISKKSLRNAFNILKSSGSLGASACA